MIAQRIEIKDIFSTTPQQSDYVAALAGNLANWTRAVDLSSLGEPHFCKIEEADLLRGRIDAQISPGLAEAQRRIGRQAAAISDLSQHAERLSQQLAHTQATCKGISS